MTGSGPPWRKAKPLAAPSAIFILLDHGRGIVPSIVLTNNQQLHLTTETQNQIEYAWAFSFSCLHILSMLAIRDIIVLTLCTL